MENSGISSREHLSVLEVEEVANSVSEDKIPTYPHTCITTFALYNLALYIHRTSCGCPSY